MAGFAVSAVGVFFGAGGLTSGFSMSSFGLGLVSLLLPGKNTQGPRMKDLNPPDSQVGTPIPKLFGKAPAHNCEVIWSKKIKEHKNTSGAGGKGGPTQTEYTYTCSFAVLVCLGPIKRVTKIRLNEKVIFEIKANGTVKGSPFTYHAGTCTWTNANGTIRYTTGTETQMPDPLIEADKGVGMAPAYRGRVVMYFEDRGLGEFGNRIPVVTVEVEEETTNVADMARWIASQVRLGENDINFSDIEGETVEAFMIDERAEAKQWMEQIGLAFQCDFSERDSGDGIRITAIRRGRMPCLTVGVDDLRVHDWGSETPDMQWARKQEIEVPREIEVSFYNPKREKTKDTARAWREIEEASDEKVTLSLSMVISKPQVERIANIELYRRVVERHEATVSLGPPLAWMTTGDPILVDTPEGLKPILLMKSQDSVFGSITYETVSYDPEVYLAPLGSDTGEQEGASVEDSSGLVAVIIESNSATDELNGEPILYIAAATPYSSTWKPVRVTSGYFQSGGSHLHGIADRQTTLTTSATLGTSVNALGDWFGDSSIIDTVNTLTVDLVDGELSSCTDDELFAGKNAALIGQEGVQFGTATLLGTFGGKRRYALSHLIRGRRGTESFMGTHSDGDTFLLLDESVNAVPYMRTGIGRTFNVKFEQSRGEEIITQIVTPIGRNLMPYSGHYATGTRDGSNNLTATWLRRSRYDSTWWDSGTDPILGESLERYSVEVLNGLGAVVRTSAILTTPTFEYSAAEQTADGLTPGESVSLRIYQLSGEVGRGYALEATV